ncbi:MAG: histidine kinase, partial [Vallitaleaceae bacterium]|nr:histidine kinase [Vallitaleaceae bacterium]
IVFDIGYDVISKIINDKASSNQILVIDKSGYVLFDKENTSNITKPYSDLKEYNGVAEGINEKKYITKLDSKELGWTYITITDTNDLFGTLNGIAKNLILLSSLCFVVFLIISIGISNNISRPLKVLEGAMEKAESNDFNEIVTNKRTYDEVNHLTRRFNVMLVEIQRLIDSEKEVQKKKANSDYKALQMQITPHFLYNSLESINCLAQIHGKEDISEMILSLADIFKYSMRLDSRYVMLEEEVNHVKNYCMLQAVRYQDKFKIVYDIPDAYLTQKVVKFMLQPIVENAIGHGMKNIEKNGEIVISVSEVNEALIVSVTDNGDGISKHKIDEINELLNQDINEIYQYNSKKGSIGLTNVHLRLKLSFGQQAGLSIFSREGKGAKISIHIPAEKRGDESV